jgi:hypothetical protein
METPVKKLKKRIDEAAMFHVPDGNRPKIERRITLRELINKNEEIWVLNCSAEYTKKYSCNVAFQVGHGDMVDMVIIPPGNDPVCITDQVDPESLKSCRDLFKLTKSGALKLLDPQDADKYYAAHAERKKIVADKINAILNPGKDKVPSRVKFDKDSPDPEKVKRGVENFTQMHPKVNDICLKARHGAITQAAAMEALLEQQPVFGAMEYQYLSTNGVFDTVKRWAKENLAQLATSD